MLNEWGRSDVGRCHVTIMASILTISAGGFLSVAGRAEEPLPSIREIADRYVTSLVGESEFDRDYKFDQEHSEDCTKASWGCYVRYRFVPAEKYGGSEYLFYYTAGDKIVKIANNDIPITLPSCEKDKNKCGFHLSIDELRAIARRENLNDRYFRLVMYKDEIVAEISYCNLDTMENRRKVLIDLQNGSIVWDGPNRECQGIS